MSIIFTYVLIYSLSGANVYIQLEIIVVYCYLLSMNLSESIFSNNSFKLTILFLHSIALVSYI